MAPILQNFSLIRVMRFTVSNDGLHCKMLDVERLEPLGTHAKIELREGLEMAKEDYIRNIVRQGGL